MMRKILATIIITILGTSVNFAQTSNDSMVVILPLCKKPIAESITQAVLNSDSSGYNFQTTWNLKNCESNSAENGSTIIFEILETEEIYTVNVGSQLSSGISSLTPNIRTDYSIFNYLLNDAIIVQDGFSFEWNANAWRKATGLQTELNFEIILETVNCTSSSIKGFDKKPIVKVNAAENEAFNFIDSTTIMTFEEFNAFFICPDIGIIAANGTILGNIVQAPSVAMRYSDTHELYVVDFPDGININLTEVKYTDGTIVTVNTLVENTFRNNLNATHELAPALNVANTYPNIFVKASSDIQSCGPNWISVNNQTGPAVVTNGQSFDWFYCFGIENSIEEIKLVHSANTSIPIIIKLKTIDMY